MHELLSIFACLLRSYMLFIMSKFIKSIPISLLWLSWIVFTAHLVFPHDHHLTDSFTTKEDSCPVSKGNTGHQSGFPVHCHAFNDLVSEKAITYVISKYIHSDKISTGCYPDALTFNFPISGIPITDKPVPVPVSYMLGLSTLRAPPSLI